MSALVYKQKHSNLPVPEHLISLSLEANLRKDIMWKNAKSSIL